MFRAELESVGRARRPAAASPIETPALGPLMARAADLHPSSRPTLIQYGAQMATLALVRFADGHVICFEPRTGEVLPPNSRFASAFITLVRLHTFAFWTHGETVAGSLALIVIALTASGLYLGWPGSARALRALLTPGRRLKGWSWHLSLHKTTGFYASAFLLTSACTGLPVAFTWIRDLVYRGTGSPIARSPATGSGTKNATVPIDDLARIAATLAPGPHHTTIRYRAGGLVECYLVAPDAPHPNARTTLFIDGSNGTVLSFVPYAQSSAGHRLYFWLLSIHTGRVGGLAGQLALLSGALAVPALAIFGVMSFWRRPRETGQPLPA